MVRPIYKILMIAAMAEEASALHDMLENKTEGSVMDIPYIRGVRHDHDIMIAESGIGKVNAANSTAILIQHFTPDYVVNLGSAGGLGTALKVGDVVIADTLTYYDADATGIGYVRGQIPQMPEHYLTDQPVLARLNNAELGVNIHTGLIVSGDSFVARHDTRSEILRHFPKALALDMESAAVAQTCYRFKVPVLVFRSISDVANQDAPVSFHHFLPLAARNAGIVGRYLCDVLNTPV